jgi:MFS family permease
MQLPNNYLLQRLPLAKYVGGILIIWGAVLLSTAWTHSFSQIGALRFLLGFFEAITYPSMFLLIATIYRRSEQVIWFGVMFMSNGMAGILGNLIGVGILTMKTVGDITPWKWAFIIFGIITAGLGFIYFLFLPDTPHSRWFRLSEEEKLIVEERGRDNAVVPTRQMNYNQIWEALREPRFYCYCLISLFINFQNGALTIFSSIIISELGFSSINATLLSIPSGACTILLIAIFITISKKKNEIIYTAMFTCTISLIGLVILVAVPSGPVKLLGIYLSWGCTPTYVLLQASTASNVSGYTKKIFYTSGNMVFYTFGNFIGPLLLRSQDSPRYLMGIGVYIAVNVIVILLFANVRYFYVQANKKRNLDGKRADIVTLPDDVEDITDVQNPHFVYRT